MNSDRSILIVEDDPSLRLLLIEGLQSFGYTNLKTFDNAHDAIAHLEAGDRPDLILTDMSMPGTLCGMDVLRAANQMNPPISAFLCSATWDESKLEEARRTGAARTFQKPFSLSDLGQAISDLFNSGSA